MIPSAFQARLAFTLTERCNLRCRHCLAAVEGGSAEGRGAQLDMPLGHLLRWIDEAAASQKVRTISFTGGEPFLAYETLVAALSRASWQGLGVTVLTNAYWASTPERARSRLAPLRTLKTLKISTDEFHQEFVPVAQVRNAVQAATEMGIKIQIKFCYRQDGVRERKRLQEQLGGLVCSEQIHAEPVYRLGRAARELPSGQFIDCDLQQPCTVANVPIVQPNGSVYACCGATFQGDNALFLGNLYHQSVPEVLDASEDNATLHFLRLWGPMALSQLYDNECGAKATQLELDTTSMCSLCYGLLTNPASREWLACKAREVAWARQVAVQRLALLGEPAMLARLDRGAALRPAKPSNSQERPRRDSVSGVRK